MPVQPSYPGVYITETQSGVRTIAGVSTSVTALVGRYRRGPVAEPVTVFKFGEFARRFGGLVVGMPASYAVDDFYTNGGSQAVILRLFKANGANDPGIATITVNGLQLTAANPGEWGNRLKVWVRHPVDAHAAKAIAEKYGLTADDLFELEVLDEGTRAMERYLNVTVASDGGARRVDRVLEAESNLVRTRANVALPNQRPAQTPADVPALGQNGNDGQELTPDDYKGDDQLKTGIHALLKTDIFNILVIPPDKRGGSIHRSVWNAAAAFCATRRAFLIVDPPEDWDANADTAAQKVVNDQRVGPLVDLDDSARNAALFFPRLRKRDPLRDGQLDVFTPSGAIAGIMARTDSARGVWKAPAGIEATLNGFDELTVKLTDDENGLLNPIGVNCLRTFPNVGRVAWGARTTRGSDLLADEYKYIPVRRLALFIEESLYRGTQWVVFSPNDEPLWAQIRMNVGSFMQRLFRQGAFKGASPREAYFVKCDSETTTPDDINRGIVNIGVGFAPLLPAEFVIINIQQIRNAA